MSQSHVAAATVSPRSIAAALTELWSPRVVGEVDDCYIKVAKVHGSLTWHAHEQEDKLFLVLKGQLQIEMESGTVRLREGEMYVVPKGVEHRPVAREEVHLLLIEPTNTPNTGEFATAAPRRTT